MNRCLGSALLVAVGILLGVAASSHQQTQAEPPATDDATNQTVADTNASALAELKEIKTQLKEINSFLRTGVMKTMTISVMNPELSK